MDRFVERVARIPWMSAPAFTEQAEALLNEYARRMSVVTRHFAATRGMNAFQTDVHVCGAGMQTPESDRLIHALFASPINVPAREHLIFNLHTFFFWDADEELRQFENAYEPLMELYELGFTTSGGPHETKDILEVTLGCRAGLRDFVFALS